MDFKKRWSLLVTMSAAFSVFLMLEKYSRCSECVTCNSCSRHEQLNSIQNDCSLKNQSLTIRTKKGYISDESEPTVFRVVYDCITWDIKKNLINRSFELIPLNVTLIETGEAASARKETFQKIFYKRDWPADDPSYGGLKASGPGAMIRNAQGAVAALHSVITKLKSLLHKSVISILDVPCGDLQWMSRFLLTRMDIEYTGADIVPDIIRHHKRKFHHYKNAKFVELDIVSNPLNHSFDLIFCRNLLQHLWISDALIVLQQFSKSGSSYLLATTFPDTVENFDVEKTALGSRKSNYNLEESPFSLGPPLCTTYDWSVEHLNLWPLPLMQKV